MSRPHPSANERKFEIEELFFSTTDQRGIILTGNSVFVKISGYSKEHLTDKPHNIIRHPDMPKAVFKLLWDTIGAGNQIGAYVKNMAADGSFYWVFAVVVPHEGSYLSIRFKPSSPILAKVVEVYKQALEAEKTQGVAGGTHTILKALKSLGFEDYGSFMTEAMIAEYSAREKKIQETPHQEKGLHWAKYFRLVNSCEDNANHFRSIYQTLERSVERSKTISENTEKILRMFKDLQFFTINMTIISKSCGAQARSLISVSEGFQKMATDVQESLVNIKKATTHISKAVSATKFQIAAARLQTDMFDFFVKEVASGKSTDTMQECHNNTESLLKLLRKTSADVAKVLNTLKTTLSGFTKEIESLDISVNALAVIHLAGRVEAARVENNNSLHSYIEEMSRFVASIKPLLGELTSTAGAFLQDTRNAEASVAETQVSFFEMERQISRTMQEDPSGGASPENEAPPLAA